jgi:class 3 adenylate cyclase/tetratricopeptide (TPR) repeat protein
VACPNCGSATRPGQKFCSECGQPLASSCPNCGAAYEGSPRFCGECGTPLAETAAAGPPGAAAALATTPSPAAERRHVTVLFADLVGFTQLSEQQDPEEVRELLSSFFETARAIIEGYGGAVEKFIGDAVMAVWGAPVAREDDAERAVRAALELVGRVRELSIAGQGLDLRAGVVSGEAAVTPGRTGEGMVAGDVVNTASRLQSVAPAGVVLVSETTHSATSPAIAYEPAGEQLLKGKQAPVAAWRALRVVARVGGEGREEGLEPPFVGRDEELRLLRDQLHAAERERKLRLVAVTGQAGIGKSRLVWELEKYLDGLAGTLYYWHQGRSPAYGEGVTFWALGEMVRRRARIAEAEEEASTREKLRATLSEFVPNPEERRWLEPALGALLGIDEVDWDARERLFSAWRTFFERIADRGPAVLVFEDLQWADSGLLDFIEHLLEWTRDRPILIVTLARPELLDRRPNFGVGHRAFVALRLEPLPDEAMAALLRGLVPALADADLARVVARAEGVPLYAVETVRSLVDGGYLVRRGDAYELARELPVLDVPATLRALIASRLDALQPADRDLLQDAAVLGLVFAVPALAALSDRPDEEIERRLRDLAHKELIGLETDPRSPERGRYRFRQGLIREVAYGMLSKRDRRSRHVAAARYFETLGDDELAAVLATHYREAYQAAPDGEEGAALAAQARVALRAAAERAYRLHSHDQAIAYLEQAMQVTFDEAERMELLTQIARSADASGQTTKAENDLRTVIAWHEARGDQLRAGELAAWLGGMLLHSSRIDEAVRILTEALEHLPEDAVRIALDLKGQLARVHMFRDEAGNALAASSQALEAAERLDLRSQTLQLMITKAWALTSLERPREATALMLGVRQMADDEDDLFARMRTRFNMSSGMALDDPHRGLELALEGMAISEQYGFALMAGHQAANAAGNALVIGDLDRVLSLEASVADFRTSLAAFLRSCAAGALALRGYFDPARERMAFVAETVAASSSAQDIAALGFAQSFIAFAAGELEEAQRLAREAREAYSGTDSVQAADLAAHLSLMLGDRDGLEADLGWLAERRRQGRRLDRSIRTSEAGALALDGRPDEALAAYRRVIDEWRAADLHLDLAIALLERAWLLGPVDEQAAAGLDEARAIFAEMGAEGLVERLEAGRGRAPAEAPPTTAGRGAAQRVDMVG